MIADTPGHVQYTRNMATAASQVDCAIVLLDASRGVLPQTRRHAAILALFGVKAVVLAVNKIDLVDFDEETVGAVVTEFTQLAETLGLSVVAAIPVAARDGDNVTSASTRTRWYRAPTLLSVLETIEPAVSDASAAFRMPVQTVLRAEGQPRLYAGTITAGIARPGDVLSSGARIARIVTLDGDRAEARAGEAVAIALDDEHDVGRGDVLAAPPGPPRAARLDARIVWLAGSPLFAGRSYLLRVGTRTVAATVTRLLGHLDLETMSSVTADAVRDGVVAEISLRLVAPVALDMPASDPSLSRFVLIDRTSAETVAAGIVLRIDPPATDVVWQTQAIDRTARAAIKGQRPRVLWFTGLPGAGKSTIADLTERGLHAAGLHTTLLDGDNLRHGLNVDLGFSEADRVENIRRAAEVARLMADAGLIVIVALISPYRADRDGARERFAPGEFLEVFVDTPIEECRRRDPKGLYARADAGRISGLSGVDAPYEPPLSPELHLRTLEADAKQLAARVIEAVVGDASPPL
jgi:bifunctional enzyme CysN/CysC